jgi:putative glutamine amidotransferase
MKNFIFSFVFLVFIGISLSCKNGDNKPLVVVSVDSHHKVIKWLSNFDKRTNFKILYKLPSDSVDFYLKKADGVIITGGEDVNPDLYGADSLKYLCGKINNYRDSLEIKMINYALHNKIPLFGICRGQQIINVSQGGTLIADIPTFLHDSIHRKNGRHTYHEIYISKNSVFYSFIHLDSSLVYSNHHQAIKHLAACFRTVALASDSVIEAIEIKDTAKYTYSFAVQFHPEAMEYSKPISKRIALEYLHLVKLHYEKN